MKLIIDFEFPEDTTAVEAIQLIKDIRQEIHNRLPEGWEAKTRIKFGDPVDDRKPC